jgi:membrane protein YqaA with SNARE-associated domain
MRGCHLRPGSVRTIFFWRKNRYGPDRTANNVYHPLDWLELGYWGLLLASFLSATVLPFSSEAVLAGMVYAGGDPVLCVAVATIGNTLGGVSSYLIGRLGKLEWMERYLGVREEKLNRWLPPIQRYGSFFAILSFMPAFGDAIPLGLGFLRVNPWLTTLWMALGKLLRYVVVIWGIQLFM